MSRWWRRKASSNHASPDLPPAESGIPRLTRRSHVPFVLWVVSAIETRQPSHDLDMAFSAFDDKSVTPTDTDLQNELGRTATHWNRLIAHAATEYPPLDQTWTYSGVKWGWSLRLKQEKRTILYMTPRRRHFVVGFALGDKAVKAVRARPLPDAVLAIIDEAPKYAEGRAVRIEVRNKTDLNHAKEIAAVKMSN